MFPRLIRAFAPFAIVTTLVGCGAASAGSPAAVVPSGPPTPASTGVPVSTLPASLPFTAGTGSGSMLLPAAASAPSGATLSVNGLTSAPTGIPAPANPASMFVNLTASATVTLTGLPGFQFSLSGLAISPQRRATSSTASYFIALFDPTNPGAGWQIVAGPGVIGNGIVVFGETQTPMTFVANESYYFELFQTGAGSGTVNVLPASLSFTGTGASNTQLLTVSEPGYTGAFTLSSTCSSIVTITPSGSQYIVVPLAAGTCSATFADANGHSAVVPIVVTVTTIVGQ